MMGSPISLVITMKEAAMTVIDMNRNDFEILDPGVEGKRGGLPQ